jgi:hypothetical protein
LYDAAAVCDNTGGRFALVHSAKEHFEPDVAELLSRALGRPGDEPGVR